MCIRDRPKKIDFVYVALVLSMLIGRAVWGLASAVLMMGTENAFTTQAFLAGAFINACLLYTSLFQHSSFLLSFCRNQRGSFVLILGKTPAFVKKKIYDTNQIQVESGEYRLFPTDFSCIICLLYTSKRTCSIAAASRNCWSRGLF